MTKKASVEVEIGGRKLELSTGELAPQANSAVLARYGDTMVLATAVAGKPAYLGYFPLSIEYVERLYAGGKIKGSRWVKREGRPSDEAILAGRLVDRSIRPLFPKEFLNEVQITITILSVDAENDPGLLSAVAASAALAISEIPWNGPVAALRVGQRDGNYFVNPTDSELSYSNLDLVISLTSQTIIMIEAGAKEVGEDKIIAAVEFAKAEAKPLLSAIRELAGKVGKPKLKIEKPQTDAKLLAKIEAFLKKHEEDQLVKSALVEKEGEAGFVQLLEILGEELGEEFEKQDVVTVFASVWREKVRKLVLAGKRPDGRSPDQIRPISATAGILPRTHGSALFARGETQVLTVTTLGSPSLEQLIESPEGEFAKRYIHHYSMPPYSMGEVGRLGWPSRREIGHGALAERALAPVIPPEEKFPYTIRVVSEVLSSNGSTSMASACGSSLSLMDAGVPIKSAVAGIAMGLVVESPKKFVILSDITGLEDANGDMDFKVAGTSVGVTALQLDVKTEQLTTQILAPALEQAKVGRLFVLEKMNQLLSSPRPKISVYAPKIRVLHVPLEKIGDVIGPGGRTIRKIIADTGAQIEMEDDGTVNISGIDEEGVTRAVSIVEGLTREVKPGEIFEGQVKRIMPFGAFVEVMPGKEGLVHVSDMAAGYVADPATVVSLGQKVKVRVKEIDELGRINLSMRLEGEKPPEVRARPRREEFHGRPRGFRSSGGPHFPTTRFLPPKKRF